MRVQILHEDLEIVLGKNQVSVYRIYAKGKRTQLAWFYAERGVKK